MVKNSRGVMLKELWLLGTPTFHGIGKTKLPVMIGLFTMWGIRIGLSWCLVHWLHVGLHTVWVCMIMDNITRCLLLAALYRWGKWKNKLFL